jgi:hypothetical protein
MLDQHGHRRRAPEMAYSKQGGTFRRIGYLSVLAGVALSLTFVTSAVGASPVRSSSSSAGVRRIDAAAGHLAATAIRSSGDGSLAPSTANTRQAHVESNCTLNGVTDIVPNVTPGSSIAIVCTGWTSDTTVLSTLFSPLFLVTDSESDIPHSPRAGSAAHGASTPPRWGALGLSAYGGPSTPPPSTTFNSIAGVTSVTPPIPCPGPGRKTKGLTMQQTLRYLPADH